MIPNSIQRILLAISRLIIEKRVENLGSQLSDPIFIVGTGRCGTTLLVKILNSHPNIVGFPGEANEYWHPTLYPESNEIEPIEINPKVFTKYSLDQWPKNHQDKIWKVFKSCHFLKGMGKSFFVKSAMISFMIPKVRDIFPNARFIHIYRNAPSVVRSYVEKNFGKYSYYTYDKKEYIKYCAKYWNDCILEIDKQKKLLLEKVSFFEFSYEELCNEPNKIITKLASFINVESDNFTFDISKISSQNYKVDDVKCELENLISEEIKEGMRLKGYRL